MSYFDDMWALLKECNYRTDDDDLDHKVLEAFIKPFVGDVVFAIDELARLKAFLKKHYFQFGDKVKQYQVTAHRCFHICLFVYIVNLAKNYTGNENEENHFEDGVLHWIFDRAKDEKIKYKDFCIKEFYEDNIFYCRKWFTNFGDRKAVVSTTKKQNAYLQTFLYHAFSPAVSTDALVKIIYSIYDQDKWRDAPDFDFPYNITPKPYEDWVEYTKQKILGFRPDFDINKENPIYNLRASHKYGFVDNPKGMAELVSRTIEYLKQKGKHEDYHGDKTYFYTNFINRYLNSNSNLIKNAREVSKIEKVRTISEWRAYYLLEDGELFICMPTLCLESRNQYPNSCLKVFWNDIEIYSKKLEVYPIGEGPSPRFHNQKILINKQYLEQSDTCLPIHLVVMNELTQSVVFDSDKKCSLRREFIIFNSNGNGKESFDTFLKPLINYYLIMSSTLAADFWSNSKISSKEYLSDNLFSINPQNKDSINTNNKSVYFVRDAEKTIGELKGRTINFLSFIQTKLNIKDIKIRCFNYLKEIDIFLPLLENKKVIYKLTNLSLESNLTSTFETNPILLDKNFDSEQHINEQLIPTLNKEGLNVFKAISQDGGVNFEISYVITPAVIGFRAYADDDKQENYYKFGIKKNGIEIRKENVGINSLDSLQIEKSVGFFKIDLPRLNYCFSWNSENVYTLLKGKMVSISTKNIYFENINIYDATINLDDINYDGYYYFTVNNSNVSIRDDKLYLKEVKPDLDGVAKIQLVHKYDLHTKDNGIMQVADQYHIANIFFKEKLISRVDLDFDSRYSEFSFFFEYIGNSFNTFRMEVYKKFKKQEPQIWYFSDWVDCDGCHSFVVEDFYDGDYYYRLKKKDFNGNEVIIYDSFLEFHKPKTFGDLCKSEFSKSVLETTASYVGNPEIKENYRKLHHYIVHDISLFCKNEFNQPIYKCIFNYLDDEDSESFEAYFKIVSAASAKDKYNFLVARFTAIVYKSYVDSDNYLPMMINRRTNEIDFSSKDTEEIEFMMFEEEI